MNSCTKKKFTCCFNIIVCNAFYFFYLLALEEWGTGDRGRAIGGCKWSGHCLTTSNTVPSFSHQNKKRTGARLEEAKVINENESYETEAHQPWKG